MSSFPVSIRAARAHISSLWNGLLKVRMPNTWVPVPVKRALMEAIIVSIHAILKSPMARRITPNKIYDTMQLLRVDDIEEYKPEPGERADKWFARIVSKKDDETVSEWIERVSKICEATMAYIVSMRITEEMLFETDTENIESLLDLK